MGAEIPTTKFSGEYAKITNKQEQNLKKKNHKTQLDSKAIRNTWEDV